MQYRQVRVVDGKFASALRAIAVDARGNLYAAGDAEVKVFDPAGGLRRRWSTARPGLCVAVGPEGAVYVGELRQIEIFTPDGKLIRTWRDEQLLNRVTAVGFSGGHILAADANFRAIRAFSRDGKFLHNIGNHNPVNGFLIPNGVLDFGVDAEGVIYAANPGKHRVERYTADGKLLGHIGRFHGVDPAGFTGCCNPTNVAVGAAIYVTEKAGPRAKAYDFSGKLLAVIAADVFDVNCKNMSIAADARGRVYVTDTVKNAIFVFEPVTV